MTPIAIIPLLALAVPIDPPALPGAMAPALSSADGAVAMTWLEPARADDERKTRLRFARLADGAWSEPVTIIHIPPFTVLGG